LAEAETNDEPTDELKTGSKSAKGRGRVAAAFFFFLRLDSAIDCSVAVDK
jgi:hypothetical protein